MLILVIKKLSVGRRTLRYDMDRDGQDGQAEKLPFVNLIIRSPSNSCDIISPKQNV